MSPFRALPQAEIGPLYVGLASAALRALRLLPRALEQRVGSILSSLAGLERHAHRAFVDPRGIHWLRRVLVAAVCPDLVGWIPTDVRGRAELLLAREIAAYHGAALAERRSIRQEVVDLLAAAADHLDDPWPARADLAALEQSPHVRVHRETPERERARERARVAAWMETA